MLLSFFDESTSFVGSFLKLFDRKNSGDQIRICVSAAQLQPIVTLMIPIPVVDGIGSLPLRSASQCTM